MRVQADAPIQNRNSTAIRRWLWQCLGTPATQVTQIAPVMPTVGAFVGPWVGPSSVATALLLASVLLPAPAAAGGFWQVAPGGPLAPGWTAAATGAAAVEAALRDEAGGAGSPPSAPMLRLPRLTERLGLVVSAGSGRPKLAGLGFRATRNLRVSARGGVDFEAGGISGEVSVAFEF